GRRSLLVRLVRKRKQTHNTRSFPSLAKEQTMKHSTTATLAVVAFGLFSTTAGAQAPADHLMVTPADLKWADVPSLPPGAKIAVIEGPLNEAKPFTARLRFPANYQVPPHYHGAIEHVTVLSGTFNLGMGDKLDKGATRALPIGSTAVMQPGTHHFG